jgi:hypothetical protein
MKFSNRRVGHWTRLTLADDTIVEGTLTRVGPTIIWIGCVMIYTRNITYCQHHEALPPPGRWTPRQ